MISSLPCTRYDVTSLVFSLLTRVGEVERLLTATMASTTTTMMTPAKLETTVNYYLDPENGKEDTFIPGTAAFHKRQHTPKVVNVCSRSHGVYKKVSDQR